MATLLSPSSNWPFVQEICGNNYNFTFGLMWTLNLFI